jgi:Flp pilus assembly protein CpaB
VTEGAGRVRGAIRGRLSGGHVAMIVAGLVGMTLTIAVLRDEAAGTEVAVATHEIRAGETIGPADVRVERIRAGRDLLGTVVAGGSARALRGEIAVATIAAHAVIPRGAVRPKAAGAGMRAMSIPIDPARAVSGRLASGDRVDVLFATRDRVTIIVSDATVLAVDERGRGGIGESTSPFTVTIAVDTEQSLLVAAAIADGNISIARTTGAGPATSAAASSLDGATLGSLPVASTLAPSVTTPGASTTPPRR